MREDLAYVAILLALFIVSFNRGFFSFSSLALLLALVFILIFIYIKQVKVFRKNVNDRLKFLFLVAYLLFLYNVGGIYQTRIIPSILIGFLPLVFLPIMLSIFFIPEKKIIQSYYYPLLIFLALILRILLIIASPNPKIDVFTVIKEAPLKLISRENPYQSIYSQVYPNTITDNFTYGPFVIFLELPWILIFNDPRILLLVSDILVAVLIYIFGKKTFTSSLLSLIYLFRPNSLFIIEQSWLVPLSSFFTILFFYSIKRFKIFMTGAILAILSGIQPYYLVLLPLTVSLWKDKGKTLLIFLLMLAIGVGPFLIWDSSSLIDKIFLFYLKPIEKLPTIPIHQSLNLNTAYFIATGKNLPFWLTLPLVMLASIKLYLVGQQVILKKQAEKFAQRFLLIVIFFYLFFLLFRQSFIYYYYYAGNLLIFWLAFSFADTKND